MPDHTSTTIAADDTASCVASILTATMLGGTMTVEDICARMVHNRWTDTVTDTLRSAVGAELANMREHGFVTEDPSGCWAMSAQLTDMIFGPDDDSDDSAGQE